MTALFIYDAGDVFAAIVVIALVMAFIVAAGMDLFRWVCRRFLGISKDE